jgi:large subunit ribosomal protein L19
MGIVMNMNIIEKVENKQLQTLKAQGEIPAFKAGDSVKVHQKVIEGDKERIQIFEGVCIARKNRGLNSSFTIRKVSFGEGVEKVYPLYSPKIAKIEVVRIGTVRRAKLYHLRGLSGKKARIAENIEATRLLKTKKAEKAKKELAEKKAAAAAEAEAKTKAQESPTTENKEA